MPAPLRRCRAATPVAIVVSFPPSVILSLSKDLSFAERLEQITPVPPALIDLSHKICSFRIFIKSTNPQSSSGKTNRIHSRISPLRNSFQIRNIQTHFQPKPIRFVSQKHRVYPFAPTPRTSFDRNPFEIKHSRPFRHSDPSFPAESNRIHPFQLSSCNLLQL